MMNLKKLTGLVAAGFGMVALGTAAFAGDSNGNFQIKAGVSGVLTDDHTSSLIVPALQGQTNLVGQGFTGKTEDFVIPTATLTYYLTKNIGLELFCCFGGTSVKADGALANLLGGDREIAHTTIFPPALTALYKFDQFGPIRPYAGVGVQYIHYFDTKVGDNGLGVVGAQSVRFSDSWGPVVQGGFDYDLGGGWSAGFDVKKSWLSTKLDFRDANNANVVTVKHDLDPLIVTANIGYRFNLSDLFGSRAAPAPLK